MQRNPKGMRTTDMGGNYRQLLQSLPRESAPVYLCEQVLGRLSRERSTTWRAAFVVFSLTCGASALGSVFAVRALAKASETSGFASFLSLAGSDSSVIAGHFSTFLATLLESLPVMETILVLGLVAVFLGSVKGIAESFGRLSSFSGARLA